MTLPLLIVVVLIFVSCMLLILIPQFPDLSNLAPKSQVDAGQVISGIIMLAIFVSVFYIPWLILMFILGFPLRGLLSDWRGVAEVSPQPRRVWQVLIWCLVVFFVTFPLAWLPFILWAFGVIPLYWLAFAVAVILVAGTTVWGWRQVDRIIPAAT